jgi:hypothetical protein
LGARVNHYSTEVGQSSHHVRLKRGKNHALEWAKLGQPVSTAKSHKGATSMAKNVVRGVLNLILVAAATWLANYLVDMIFGPDDEYA